MKPKVLLINPPAVKNRKISRNIDCAAESKGEYLLQPFDFILLSGIFSTYCDVNFLDAAILKINTFEIIKHVIKYSPNFIVFAIADVTWEHDIEVLQHIRAEYPFAKMFILGDAFVDDYNADAVSTFTDGIIVDPLQLDIGKTISQETKNYFCVAGFRNQEFYKKDISKAPLLSVIPTPKHELFVNLGYKWPFGRNEKYATVVTSWGCPYKCSYCIDSRFPVRYRSSDAVIQELKYIQQLGVKEIYFADKAFGIPSKNILDLLEKMLENNFGFSWSTYMHPQNFGPKLLDLMKEAGCHTIIIGIETHNLDSLKQFNRNVNLKSIQELIAYAHTIGMEVCGDFLFGLPDESIEDIQKTINMSLELGIDYASYNLIAPLPGTTIKYDAIKDGRMRIDDHHYDSMGKARNLESPKVSAQALVELRNQAVRRFYLRISYLFKRLTKIKSFMHLKIQLKEMFTMFKKLIT